MRSPIVVFLLGLMAAACSASVFLPTATPLAKKNMSSLRSAAKNNNNYMRRHRRSMQQSVTAMAIPGNGVVEQVFVGGFANFLQIYNLVITVRILLSWFPQAQGVGALQPVFAVTDPFLNLFRGVIPPIGGLDLSPLAAFFLLNVVTNATAAVGAEIPEHVQKQLQMKKKKNSKIVMPFGIGNRRRRSSTMPNNGPFAMQQQQQ